MRIFRRVAPLLLAGCAVDAGAQQPSAYQTAVAERLAGHPERARSLLIAWLAEHPADVDARLQLAEAELALGNSREAKAQFSEVLRQAPDYADARAGLERALLRQKADREARRGSALFEGAVGDLAGAAPGWSEISTEIELPSGSSETVGGRASWFRRFGVADIELTGKFGVRASPQLWLRAFASTTPDADFRPEIAIGAGLDHRVRENGATVVTFDGSWQRFPLQSVVTLNPGFVRYVAGGAGWITLRGIGTVADGGPVQVGAMVRGDYVPRTNWRIFAGAANGPDTDLGVVTRVSSIFGGIEAPLTDQLGAFASIGRDWRAAGSDRTDFRIGLKTRL